MITKKHFKAIAHTISTSYFYNDFERDQIVLGLCEIFQADNPAFDRTKFVKACEYDGEKSPSQDCGNCGQASCPACAI